MHKGRTVVHSVYEQLAASTNVVERMLSNTLNAGRFDNDVESISSKWASSDDEAGGTAVSHGFASLIFAHCESGFSLSSSISSSPAPSFRASSVFTPLFAAITTRDAPLSLSN